LASETLVRRIDKEILFPALVLVSERYKKATTPAEKKLVVPGCKNWEGFLKSLKVSSSILRVWDSREKHKDKTAVDLYRVLTDWQA
jgi:hypothetical protein